MDDERESALRCLLWDMDDSSIKLIEGDYKPKCYGIELPDRLLWQAFVVNSDISRPVGSEYHTARPSQPEFQDMNHIAIWKSRKTYRENKGLFKTWKQRSDADEPRVVLWQANGGDFENQDPMDPRGLIMAYEEYGRVLPVVSDFDCFTMGTRGVQYDTPLPSEQVECLQWCVSKTKFVLDQQQTNESSNSSWTLSWLQVLKSSVANGFNLTMPRFGFGDKKSYSIMESAVSRLQGNGAVRHGAECFNYFFPQELDDHFLIVSDLLPGKVPWTYVGVGELQSFLLRMIDLGFTFPLNPKWVLCDKGWKNIYDRLLQSSHPNVQGSLQVWFPPDSGIRNTIESVSSAHPDGFVCHGRRKHRVLSGTEAMDLATLQLRRYLAFKRAKAKLRAVIAFNGILKSVSNEFHDGKPQDEEYVDHEEECCDENSANALVDSKEEEQTPSRDTSLASGASD